MFFTEVEDLKYQDLEWRHIQNSYLGRRINSNFNTLRKEKEILQYQLKEILENKEKEIHELSERLKRDAFLKYKRQLNLNYRMFEDEANLLRKQYTRLQNTMLTTQKVFNKLKLKYYE